MLSPDKIACSASLTAVHLETGAGGRGAGSLGLVAPISSRDFIQWEPRSGLLGRPRPFYLAGLLFP